jgi:hypothetical protein
MRTTNCIATSLVIPAIVSQELFAHELTIAEKDRQRLLVRNMELQYLSELGVPMLVTWSTPITSVLSSSALLLSDRPIAELVAQGFAPPAQPSAATASCDKRVTRQLKKTRKQLHVHKSRKLLDQPQAGDQNCTGKRMLTSSAESSNEDWCAEQLQPAILTGTVAGGNGARGETLPAAFFLR